MKHLRLTPLLALAGLLAGLPAGLLSTSASAQAPAHRSQKSARAPAFTTGAPIRITMTNDGFVPARITLRNGADYVLQIRNRSDRAHNFSAPPFFKYARVAPRDSAWVANNRVELKPGERATLHIVAPDTPGARYDFRSTRIEDAASGMKGEIFVR